MREVSHELVDKLIHYDPACAMAFIALDEQTQKMLGVVRLHDNTSGETAAFAILERSRLKDHGVGWLLMKHMVEFSGRKDLKVVQGQVLSENTSMLAMCAELGFHIADDPDDRAIVQAIISLAHGLGLQVVAEGVETEAQKDFLEAHECHAYQGYLFDHPAPIEDFGQLLQ